MRFPITTKLVQTSQEGIYLRPDYAPEVTDEDAPNKTDVEFGMELLRDALCDSEGNQLEQPTEQLGLLQARQVVNVYLEALEREEKRGSGRRAKR